MFWFLKRGNSNQDKKIANLSNSIKDSFSNIKQDINQIFKYIETLNKEIQDRHSKHESKHEEHSERFNEVIQRLDLLEDIINNPKKTKLDENWLDKKPKEDISSWDELTDVQKIICFKLASLQKENKDLWIPFKNIVRELYPDKDYDAVRSMITQYTYILEELGYVKRRRKGRQTYLKSTEKNPYSKERSNKISPKHTKKSTKIEAK